MRKRLDSAQLESIWSNCNNLKENDLKYKKKYMDDTCRKTPLPLVRREKTNFIYIYIYIIIFLTKNFILIIICQIETNLVATRKVYGINDIMYI